MAGEVEKLVLFSNLVWSKRWLILIVQLLAAAGMVTAYYVIPPKYRSSTTIRFEPESVLNPLTQGLAVSSQMESLTTTMRQELMSRKHIEDVIKRLELEPPATEASQHVKLLRSMAVSISVDVTTPRRRSSGASLFHISYTGDEPQLTQRVTESLAVSFIEKTQSVKRSESEAAYDFINQQLEIYRQKLEESENALRDFEERHLDALPENRNSNIARLETLKATLRDVQHRIDQARVQKDLLIKRISGEAIAEEGQGLVANPLTTTIREKEAELLQLKRRFADNYPDVVNLSAEIRILREEVERNPTVPASEATMGRPSVMEETVLVQLQQVDAELEALTARMPSLEGEIEAHEKMLRSVPRSAQELVRLQRDYDVNSNIYEMFLRRLEEARVSRELEFAKKGAVLKIVEEANLPLEPFLPKRGMFFLLGIAAGLGLNMALLYWFFSKDTSFRNVRDAQEYLGLTVVARIPRIAINGERKGRVFSGLKFTWALGVYAVLYVGAFYWHKVFALFQKGL